MLNGWNSSKGLTDCWETVERGDVCAKAGGQGVLRLPHHGAPALLHHLGSHSQQNIYIFRNPKDVSSLQKYIPEWLTLLKHGMLEHLEMLSLISFWSNKGFSLQFKEKI